MVCLVTKLQLDRLEIEMGEYFFLICDFRSNEDVSVLKRERCFPVEGKFHMFLHVSMGRLLL